MDRGYCYPGLWTLRNNFNLFDHRELHEVERLATAQRLLELRIKPIKGNFDLEHLKKIHHYIFQDVYEWAGKLRTVTIGKGGTWFLDHTRLEIAFGYVHEQLSKENFLRGIKDLDKFCERLAHYSDEINYIHPFREGNGRSTREYLRVLALEVGYELNYAKIDGVKLFNAFVESVHKDSSPLYKVYKEYFEALQG